VQTTVPYLTAKLADLHGLGTLVTVGWPSWKPRGFPSLSSANLGSLGPGWASVPSTGRRSRALPWDSAAIAVDFPSGLDLVTLRAIGELLRRVPLALLRVPEPLWDSVADEILQGKTDMTFLGRVSLDDGTDGRLAILDRGVSPPPGEEPPSSFRVLAVITAFNEADILESVVGALRQDGVDVHVVDNWSTDGTSEVAARLAEAGAITLERWPSERPATFNHGDLLRRIEEIAAKAGDTWVVHHDADERRRPPWPGVTLKDALWRVDRSGFNAVNHTVLTFRPIDDTWRPGDDPEEHLPNFEIEPRFDLMLQIRAWRARSRVDLASSGGHEAQFEGRRVFPYHFLLKHYPLRSQEQAERKVYRERRGRWNQAERARGWHHHYDHIPDGQSFIWPAEGLSEFVDGHSQDRFMIPFIGGAEVGQPWATTARMAAIENDYMRDQTTRVQRRLEHRFGPTAAALAVKFIRRFAWIVRPVRRALARRRSRRSPVKPSMPNVP
jgi:hypothetical protein